MPVSDKAKLIYIGDPMCSWCYGIAPELEELKKEFEGKIEFELVMGGLRPYNTQTMVELKEFLSHHWEEVNGRSGQEFNYAILDSKDITYDTEPPCRANMIVRELSPSKAFTFFHLTQTAFYKENKDMHRVESYFDILKELDVDQGKFKMVFESEESKERIQKDFQRSADLGVNSFPTILLEYKGETTIIAKGYSTKDKMSTRIKHVIQD